MPNPTDEQLKARLAATGYTQAQLDNPVQGQQPVSTTQQTTPTISLDTLQNPQTPLQTPKVESSAPPVADLSSYIDRYKNLYQAQPQEQQLADVYKTLFDTQSQGGRQAAATQAQEQYGYNARQSEADAAIQRVSELNDQITQARNLSMEQYSGTDALQGFVDARTESIVRKIAAERDRQQAVAELAQGRADRALQLSQQAVDNEFADRTDRMNALVNYGQYLSQQIERGELRADKTMQRAIEAQTRDYERQQRELEAEKQTRKDIAQIMLTARQYGADDATVKRIQSAGTFEDAIALAGNSLRDPKAIYELEGARLANILRREQIATEQKQRSQIGQPTATERKEAQALSQAQKTSIETSAQTLSLAKDLKQRMERIGGGKQAVGLSRVLTGTAIIPGTPQADFKAKFDQLKDSLAFGNIDKLKGAMSDKDIEFLRNIGTSLRLQQSDKAFEQELSSIINRMDAKITPLLESQYDTAQLNAIDTYLNAPTSPTPVNFTSPSEFF